MFNCTGHRCPECKASRTLRRPVVTRICLSSKYFDRFAVAQPSHQPLVTLSRFRNLQGLVLLGTAGANIKCVVEVTWRGVGWRQVASSLSSYITQNASRGRVPSMTENQIVRQLHGIAGKLTADPDLHMDLMQEMFVHLVQIQTAEPGQTLSWYLKSCEFHARTCLKPGRKINSPKRDRNNVPQDEIPAAGNGV